MLIINDLIEELKKWDFFSVTRFFKVLSDRKVLHHSSSDKIRENQLSNTNKLPFDNNFITLFKRTLTQVYGDYQSIAVNFHANPALSYSDREIADIKIEYISGHIIIKIYVNFLGLDGVLGILPLHDREEALNSFSSTHDAFKKFIDHFNNNFISLFYDNYLNYNSVLIQENSVFFDKSSFYCYVQHILMRHDISQKKGFLFHYKFSDLYFNPNHNKGSLKAIVDFIFNVDVTIYEFYPVKFIYHLNERTQLSITNGHNELSRSFMLGGIQYNVDNIKFTFTALSWTNYLNLLPGNENYFLLYDVICDYAPELFFKNLYIELEVVWDNVQFWEFSNALFKLGLNTWLKTPESKLNKKSIVFILSHKYKKNKHSKPQINP